MKLTSLSLVVVFLASAAGAPALARAGREWREFSPAGEEFSVLLPEAPTVASKQRPNKRIEPRYEGRIYAAYGEGVVYVVTSENNPRRAEKLDRFVEEFRKDLYRAPAGQAEMSFARELTLKGFKGRRHRIRLRGVEGVVDSYMTDEHVYHVEAVGAGEDDPRVRRFLDSFTLGAPRTPGALSPADGGGETAAQDPGQVFTPKEVERRAIVVSRPEPGYTEEARQNNVTGVVVLKAVFTSEGKVRGIEVIESLPRGLTGKAVAAAHRLKFIPAIKDGKFVSQRVQIEYHFNIY